MYEHHSGKHSADSTVRNLLRYMNHNEWWYNKLNYLIISLARITLAAKFDSDLCSIVNFCLDVHLCCRLLRKVRMCQHILLLIRLCFTPDHGKLYWQVCIQEWTLHYFTSIWSHTGHHVCQKSPNLSREQLGNMFPFLITFCLHPCFFNSGRFQHQLIPSL